MSETTLQTLLEIKEKLTQIDLQSEGAKPFMSKLWTTLVSADDSTSAAILSSAAANELGEFFSPLWAAYIATQEGWRAREWANSVKAQGSVLALEAYDGVSVELAAIADVPPKRLFVMVGCGPYPETLLAVKRAVGNSLCAIGIDHSAEALASASRYCEAVGIVDVNFVQIDGAAFDYREVGGALIANGIVGKRAVLARMAETLASGCRVLVRTPVRLGRLLYEDPFDDGLISGFRTLQVVASSALGRTHVLEAEP